MRAITTVSIAAMMLLTNSLGTPASAAPAYTGEQFEELFPNAPLDVAEDVGLRAIVGNPVIDARNRALAENRGFAGVLLL